MVKKKQTIALVPALVIVWLLCSAVSSEHIPTLVILPFEVVADNDLSYIADGMATLLPSRISAQDKISVVDTSTLKKALTPQSLSSPQHKIKLARKLNADFILDGTITKIGNSISVDASLIEIVRPDKIFPVCIQVPGLDSLIPETNTLAAQVKNIILQNIDSTLGQEIPVAPPVRTSAPVTEPVPVPAEPVRIQETPLPEEKTPSPPVAPLEQKVLRPTIERDPLFESTPFLTHTFSTTAMQIITTADIDADGRQEIVLATADTLHFYNLDNATLTKKHELKTGISENIVDITAADINGNGVNELYVSCYEGRYANSFVVEMSDNAFKRLDQNLKWFFRVYNHPRDGRILLGQKADIGNPFTGELFRFDWQNNRLNYLEEIIVPTGLNIYAFTEADFYGDGSIAYLGFNKGLFSQSYQLALFSLTGRIKWRDSTGLGGSPRSFLREMHEQDLNRNEIIPLRIICEDINHDRTIDILIAKNIKQSKGLLSSLSDYTEGTLNCLQWDGLDMISNWTSPALSEYISDYTLADMDGDGNKELYILSVASEGIFGRAINTISGFKTAH